MQATHTSTTGASVVSREVAQFDALAAKWWDPDGPMAPLHRMNPLRIGWIDDRLAARRPGPWRILDLGCGAGLAAEALARREHDVLGVDAAPAAIAAARSHAAADRSLRLAYRVADAEALVAEGLRFEAVVSLEVIEHVADPAAFLRLISQLLEPGGLAVISTLNRTIRALAFAKIGAEYLARLLPRGTHDWRQFVTPAELSRHARAAGLDLADIAGMVPHPLFSTRGWRTSRDTGVNYIACLERY